MNPGILKALLNLKERDISYIFKSLVNTPKSSTENAYKNRVTHSVQVAKCFYYEKQLQMLKSNAKATWRIPYIQSINRLMYPIAGINLNYRKGQRQ